MATMNPAKAHPPQPTGPAPIPPLRNGERLTRDEFERHYDAMPDLKKAELIEGIVRIPMPDSAPKPEDAAIMTSPVSFRRHGSSHYKLVGWLAQYSATTPGTEGADNSSIRLDPNNMPQPDVFLIIEPESGGQATVSADDYLEGAPELVAEVSSSSVREDLGDKLNAYQRNGVREYIVWRIKARAVDWFVLRQGQFERLEPGADDLYRSEVFPGVWLDPEALVRGDLEALLAAVRRGIETPEHAAFVAQLRDEAARRAAPPAGPGGGRP
jgi:Uma2 family endonuclease